MPRDGALTLADVRSPTVSVVCECGRCDRYAVPALIDQHGVLVFAGRRRLPTLGGGKVLLIQDFMNEISFDSEWGLAARSVRNKAIPEQYVILRSLQFAANYWITA